ncbi:MAG: hypothetical protein V7632_3360 [Bradyrhizobium sp.]
MPICRSGARTAGLSLFLVTLLVTGGAGAAPVRLDQVPAPAPSLEAPAELLQAPAAAQAVPVVPRAQPGPLAAQVEGSGSQTHVFDPASERTLSRSTRRPDAQGPAAGKTAPAPIVSASDGADIDPDLKEAAKAARQWVEESVPWAQQRSKGQDDSSEAHSRQRDATESEAERAIAGELYPGSATDGRGPRMGTPPAEMNIGTEAVKFIKEVLSHPMTWLVVALVVMGMVAVSMAKRRAK